MIIKAVSDTHRGHVDYTDLLKDCDIIIHAGDADAYDEMTYETFKKWAIKVSKQAKFGMILVPGNHDRFIADDPDYIKEDFLGTDVHLLINDYIELGGLKIFGSPYSLAFGDTWTAFAGDESDLEKKAWNKIPQELDILITHTPPWSVLDSYLGSRSLLLKVQETKPKIHIFGHIHQGSGIEESEDTTFVNAATPGGVMFGPFNPTEIQYDPKKRKVLKVIQTTMK